jgi:hypothetical protein
MPHWLRLTAVTRGNQITLLSWAFPTVYMLALSLHAQHASGARCMLLIMLDDGQQ